MYCLTFYFLLTIQRNKKNYNSTNTLYNANPYFFVQNDHVHMI